MKTPAAILYEQKKPLVIDEVEVPVLRYGQVLVEIGATRICGSQIGEIDGVKGPDKYLPHLLGHEAGVTVLETGPDVRQVKPGDRAVLHWRPGRGIESGGSVYRCRDQAVNAGNITTFQKYSVVSENRLTPVPAGTDFEVCALLADTLTTGFGVITRDAQVRIGQSVVIVGCGGIGLGVVLGAMLAGAHPIIAVDLHDHKLVQARATGATHTINATRADFSSAARDILGRDADVVIDGTGLPGVIEKCYELTSSVGRCVIFGVMPKDKKLSINTLPLHFGKILVGSHGGGSQPAEDIPRYLAMMENKRFNVSHFISHRLTLDQVNSGIEKMRSGEVIHAVMHPA